MIARLGGAEVIEHLDALVELLRDSVDSGASVGFLPPLARAAAEQYWRGVAGAAEAAERRVFALFEGGELAGTVQLQRATMPNQFHRGDVMKLMVHTKYRGRGYSRVLMDAAENEAREMGLRLLVLDTKQGDVAEGLYRKLGWTEAGAIPGYAFDADGTYVATVIFYKELA